MSDRDEKGRLLPGHSQPGPGRPKRETEQAILHAITSALSPAEITSAIKTALDLAIEQKSARGIIAVLELAAGYGIGKPTVRVEQIDDNPMTEKFEEWKRARLEAVRQVIAEHQQTQLAASEG